MLFVTDGEKGSYLFYKEQAVFSPGFKVETVDTTGCGDAFHAGVLYQILENDFFETEMTMKDMQKILQFGNAMGAYVAQYKGGIPAMPTLAQIEAFMNENN